MQLIFSIYHETLQELRDIAMTEGVKGKHFFLETDIKGPSLKLDNTGKAILTVSVILFRCRIWGREKGGFCF